MKRRYILPFFFLAAIPAFAELEPVKMSDTIKTMGGLSIGDMIPEAMVSPDVTPLIDYVGDTFALAFADYRDRDLRKADVHFSTKVDDLDGMRSSVSGIRSDHLKKISGQDCVFEDAILIYNLRCLVGGVVLTLTKGAEIGVSEADKAAQIDELLAFAGEFPLEAIAAAQGEGALQADLAPDPQKRLDMRVPGMKVSGLGELVPPAIQNAKVLDVKFIRNDLGYLLEVNTGDSGYDPSVDYFLSDWKSFKNEILDAHANAGESGKVVGAKAESWAVKVDGYPCLAIGYSNQAKLHCAVDGVSVLLSQDIYDDEGAPDPTKGTLAKLLEYAAAIPFQTIAIAQK